MLQDGKYYFGVTAFKDKGIMNFERLDSTVMMNFLS